MKLTLLKHQSTQEGKGFVKSKVEADPCRPRLDPDADLQVRKIPTSPRCPHLIPAGQSATAAPEAEEERETPRSAHSSLRPRNKPALLQPARERMQRRHARNQHHTSKHTLDVKVRLIFFTSFGHLFLCTPQPESSTLKKKHSTLTRVFTALRFQKNTNIFYLEIFF